MKQKVTAAEFMAELNADPEYVARRKALDEAVQRRHEENVRAEAPLVAALRAAEVPVNSAWDLVNTRNIYAKSLPILLEHLQRPYPDAVRDGIARALAVPEARFAWPILVKLYRQESEKRTKAGLAIALSNVADDSVMDELIALAKEPQHGVGRVLLLDALRRWRLPEARKVLEEFATDPQIQKGVRQVLAQLKRAERRTTSPRAP
jgi:hypothetical protein